MCYGTRVVLLTVRVLCCELWDLDRRRSNSSPCTGRRYSALQLLHTDDGRSVRYWTTRPSFRKNFKKFQRPKSRLLISNKNWYLRYFLLSSDIHKSTIKIICFYQCKNFILRMTHTYYDKQSRMFIKDGLSSLILAGNMTQEGREVRGYRVVRSDG